MHVDGYMSFSNDEIARYSRHLIMPEVGLVGQSKLKAARVLCIGTGGLGSPLAMYLAAAGVGTIGLVDSDVVDYSNLQRQLLHHTSDVGRPKVVSACEKLNAMNPFIDVVAHETMLTADNAMALCADYDIIVDGTDNFPTRYLTNDVCVLLGKPNVHASIFRFEGQASVFDAKRGPCYRCLYPDPPPPGEIPSCAEGGVLGILPGLLGVIQATEIVKLILGIGEPLIGRLLSFDALDMRTREFKLKKNPNCPACSANHTIKDVREVSYEHFCGISDATARAGRDISPMEASQILSDGSRPVTLLDVRDPHEWDICRIKGAIHIPLGSLAEHLDQLDPASDYIVYCLMGGRSKKAQVLLNSAGFSSVTNLKGGIRAWAADVEPSMPVY